MSFWVRIIELFDMEMTEPSLYGWFHIMFLCITVLATVLLCKFFKEGTEKQVRMIVLTASVIAIFFEVYKQINFTFSVENGIVKGDFQWYAFPFQFCSMPMYVGLLFGVLKQGKVRDCLAAFLATYSLFAGLGVMLFPDTVFISTIGINIQTMVHHGSMLVIGFYLLYTGYVKARHSTILRAMPVFASAVALAVIFNEIAHSSGLLENETFNMFYFSPYYEESNIPVYAMVHSAIDNYPVRLILYVFGFSLVAYIILLLAMAVKKLGFIITNRNKEKVYSNSSN